MGAAGSRSPLHIRPFRSTRLPPLGDRLVAHAGCTDTVPWRRASDERPRGPECSPFRLLIARDNRLMAPLTPLCIHHTHTHTHTRHRGSAVLALKERLPSRLYGRSVRFAVQTSPVEHPGQGQLGGYAVISLRCNPPSQASPERVLTTSGLRFPLQGSVLPRAPLSFALPSQWCQEMVRACAFGKSHGGGTGYSRSQPTCS